MDGPSPPDLRQVFGCRLGHTARQWRRAMDQRLQPFGLTEATWLPLLYVARSSAPKRQNELADRLGIESSTLVRLIDALDRAGLIERQTCGDRRARTLHITERGRLLVEQVEADAAAASRQILAGLSEAELATALGVFEHICAGLGQERALEPVAGP